MINTNVTSTMQSSLPFDVDIFSKLSPAIYENEDARMFLNCLGEAVKNAEAEGKLKDVDLHKLVASEYTETALTLEWIYYNFRAILTFDKDDDAYYYLIAVHEDNKSLYRSDPQLIDTQNCSDAAEAVLNFVLSHLKR